MPTTLPRADARHRAALTRAARAGGTLARLVRQALAAALRGLPDRPGPHDALRLRGHVEGTVRHLAGVLGDRLKQLLLDAARREHWLSAVALTRASRRVPDRPTEFREDWRDYLGLILPAPALDWLEHIVGPVHRLLTRLIDPQRAGNVVLQGVAAGKDRREIAKDLTDVFGGFEASARRVARTEGLRVATATQLAVSEGVPELVTGYELHTVLDARVRPEHRRMHGARFYREPKAGQRPLSECPQPPVWNGELAWNCRCFLVPIISIDGEEV